MSHVTTISLRVKDLDCLGEAAQARGMELRRDQTSFRSYSGQGKCLHAIGFPGDRSSYEIGVTRTADASGEFELQVDFWNQQKLVAAVGPDANKLRQEYAAAVASKKAKATLSRHGFTQTRENLPDGRIRLLLRKR